MNILRDFTLQFDLDAYVALRGEAFARLLERPALRRQVEDVLAEVPALVQPVACYDQFRIVAYLHDRVKLRGGHTLGGGPLVQVIGGAEALVVAIVTLGPIVDERIRQLQSAGQRFQALVLDELASWAVDQVRRQLYDRLVADFRARDWHVSTFLSPGESAWSVRDQRVIFNLLDAAQIGVSLSPGYVMTPLKSLSLVCGVGDHLLGVEGLTNCDFCSLRDRCAYAYRGWHGTIPLRQQV
jgi:hypothetical protein